MFSVLVVFTKRVLVEKHIRGRHKRRPKSGKGVCPVWTFFGQEGGLQMRTSALFGAKFFGFFKIYGVSARTRLSQGGCFADKRGGQFFAILCGRPLLTAP